MTTMQLKPIPFQYFTDSPDAGDPRCLCSLCGFPIGEDDTPIRMWTDDGKQEARFHFDCFKSIVDIDPPRKEADIAL